jgi:prevent-host-death family protein
MQVSVAQIKAKFTAIAKQADAGEEVIITTRGRPAYRLLPIIDTPKRAVSRHHRPGQTIQTL